MPILSLLKEWSELEPEKCSYAGGFFAIRGWTLTHESEISDRLINAEIQCAVQEAIESHAWNWYLGRVNIDKNTYYKSRIALVPGKGEENKNAQRLNIFLSRHSPTHVLLQAYLQALYVSLNLAQNDLLVPENVGQRHLNSEISRPEKKEKLEPIN